MKEDDGEEVLLRITATISDGHPVDWEGVHANHPEVRQEIPYLRLLEAIAKDLREPGDYFESSRR